MNPKLKYSAKIEALNLKDCPNSNSNQKDCIAYRWCYERKDHPDAWTTQASKLERDGKFPRKNSSEVMICNDLALSFFDSELSAKQTWKFITPINKSKLGYKSILKGSIFRTDGLCTPTSGNGHFNFHEFDGCDLNDRFDILDYLA